MGGKIKQIGSTIPIIIIVAASCWLPVRGTEMPKEPILFSVIHTQEDGMNGYYTRYPDIQVKHKDENNITKYKVVTSDKKVKQGTLKELDEVAQVDQSMLGEGTNQLEVWMEDKEGQKLAVEAYIRQIKIDTTCPTIQVFAPKGFRQWYQEKTVVTASASENEQGSGIVKIECFLEGEKVGEVASEQGVFAIQRASEAGKPLRIKICAYDNAGNVSSVEKELYIDQQSPKMKIEGIQHLMITSQPLDFAYMIQEENVLQEFGAITKKTDANKQETKLIGQEWNLVDGISKMSQSIKEDGIYQMEMYAIDAAGNKSIETAQVILDQTNPIISYVETLHGAYYKEFVWQYAMQETIKDLTSYTYEILLDGNVYIQGRKITQEGQHILKVKAVDAAGNKAISTATFMIDRTKPNIQFLDIEEGGIYEEEKKFRIQVKEIEDQLLTVKINGKEQKNQRGNVYQIERKGEYLIEVVAQDKAGNKSESTLFFQVVPKKSIVSGTIHNIKTTMGLETKKRKTPIEEQETPQLFLYVLLATIVTALAVYVRKQKTKTNL